MTRSQRIEPTDYSHLIVACLLHDIGYMRGVLSGDTETEFIVDDSGKTTTLPRGASDAALLPYHVDRSKLFAYERLRNSAVIDASRVAAAIEMTRFPVRPDRASANGSMEPKLVQAATSSDNSARTMDEVSSYVRLDLLSVRRQGRPR